jgi:uroporphyrinogen decarboxylase
MADMTKRERVHASIARKGMDILPWQFDLTIAVIERLKAHLGCSDPRAVLDDHMRLAVQTAPSLPADDFGPEFIRTEFGAVWRKAPRDIAVGNWGDHVDFPLKEASLAGYRFPDGSSPGRWEQAAQFRRQHPDLFVVATGAGLFEAGWALCGFENYLAYAAGEERFIDELTEKLAGYSVALTAGLAGLGFDGIRFGDDWGFQDRLMLRPELWRRLYKKHYARIYAAARAIGLVVMIHSCGNITDILGDLIDIGVQVVHPLQPEAMDVAWCKKEFGRDLAFWGGLGSQSTLPLGTPADVRREVLERLELFEDGGFILAPAGAAPAETPAENIVEIVRTAREQKSWIRVERER